MGFKDQLLLDAGNVFLNNDEYSETVLFTPQDGLSVSTRAVITYENDPNPGRGGTSTTATILLPVAVVGSPKYGDSVMIGVEYWKVLSQVARDAAIVTLLLRKERSERAIYR